MKPGDGDLGAFEAPLFGTPSDFPIRSGLQPLGEVGDFAIDDDALHSPGALERARVRDRLAPLGVAQVTGAPRVLPSTHRPLQLRAVVEVPGVGAALAEAQLAGPLHWSQGPRAIVEVHRVQHTEPVATVAVAGLAGPAQQLFGLARVVLRGVLLEVGLALVVTTPRISELTGTCVARHRGGVIVDGQIGLVPLYRCTVAGGSMAGLTAPVEPGHRTNRVDLEHCTVREQNSTHPTRGPMAPFAGPLEHLHASDLLPFASVVDGVYRSLVALGHV